MGMNVLWTEHDDTVVAGLLSEVSGNDFGHVSPSIYETARLVSDAPWLTGDCARVRFVLSAQNPDGGWGPPDGYDIVPTLSATEALLTALRRPESICDLELGAVIRATADGLRMLSGRLGGHQRRPVPDTIAVELIVPWLVARINAHLDGLRTHPMAGLDPWSGTRLTLPSNVDEEPLARLHDMVHSGYDLPEKFWHSFEVFDDRARQTPFVRPAGGVVCGSAAATAAWLGSRTGHRESSAFLEGLQARHGGPVPGITPIDLFERAWVTSMLLDAGVVAKIPRNIVESMQAALTQHGLGAGSGMPVDSDDTAAALYALARLGLPRSPESLWSYELDDRFCCFPGERTPSISTNAHILDAFGEHARLDPAPPARLTAGIGKAATWLLARQEPDGSWQDKWHASPYYATMCCTLALARFGGTQARTGVARAVSWVLETQRADGSWGRWEGTVEETAYAVQLLLHANAPWSDDAVALAAFRGQDFLRQTGDTEQHPPLWHDKDLYTPIAVVRAARLAALHLAAHRADVASAAMSVASEAR
jgi:halimadienyl-diphosphate synthase